MPNAGSFEQFRLDLLDPRHGQPGGVAGQAPAYQDGSVDEGRAWAHALGQAQDAEMTLLRTAALSRFPQHAPDDGLDALGQGEFLLERMPGQSNDSYRATLRAAWPTYAIGGSPDAVVASLRAYGIPDVTVIREEDGGWPHVWYSRFTVKLGPNLGILSVSTFIIGQGIIGQTRIGVAFTDASQRVAVKAQILRWKASHGYAADILLDASAPGGVLGRTFIGRLIGLNIIIGQTPIGGYDRS